MFDPQRSDAPVILKSYNVDGEPKTNGGDEYYITYSMPENEKGYPDAVAHSKDLGDGVYELQFVQPLLPGPAISGDGTISVILQYTCGLGGLMPPTKAGWSTGGAVNRLWEAKVDASVVPPIVMARDRSTVPEQFGFAFSNYKNAFSVGDSLMSQFIGGLYDDDHWRRSYMEVGIHLGQSLSAETLEFFVGKVHDLLEGRDLHGSKGSNSALILGSGVWDLLDNNEKWQPNFDDHMEAVKQYIQAVQEMTGAQIYWKSMTAMHINVMINPLGFDRARYMSSTRAKSIYDKQVELMRGLNIPVLDMLNVWFDL